MKPIIIPIFLPFLGCPNRCIFCNQRIFSQEIPTPLSIHKFLEATLRKLPSKDQYRKKQIAFYGGSFTSMEKKDQITYLKTVEPFLDHDIDSLRISTRPDALDEETLEFLRTYHVKTIEIGAQSLDDRVLLLSQRGHTKQDTIFAVKRLKSLGYEVGIHLMIGLPGDNFKSFLETIDLIIDLRPNFVRIHPTLVLKGTPLEELWRSKHYSPLSFNESIEWLKQGILKLERSSITTARIGLQPTKELEENLLAGPYHPSLHQIVESSIFFDMAKSLLQKDQIKGEPIFICNPKDESNLKGERKENLKRLKEFFGLKELTIKTSDQIEKGTLTLQTPSGTFSIDKKSLST